MDQIKIGKFISTKRREKNITQTQLAEMLNITDRAISKWERGNCMPDAGTIPELCEILDITINDLFSGEVVDMNKYDKKLENNLLELAKDKEFVDKQLLNLEIFIGIIISIFMLSCTFLASFLNIPDWLRVLLIIAGIIPFVIGLYYAIKIEQIAGYYECSNCQYRYVPSYKKVLFSKHINRTRKMRCPKCNNKSWHKKVLQKNL